MLRCREQREEAGSLSHGSLGQKKESMEGKVLSFDGWKCSRNNRKEQMNTLRFFDYETKNDRELQSWHSIDQDVRMRVGY